MADPSIVVAALTAALLWVGLLLSIAGVGPRLWPPGDRRPALILNWGLVATFDIATIVVVARRWNSWILPRTTAVLVLGLVAIGAGAAFAVAAARQMSPGTIAGASGALLETGLYARSRHPQYLGMTIALAGVMVIANSRAAALLLSANVGWLWLRAVAEEQILLEENGERYERYCERVPFAIGLRSTMPERSDGRES